jgi:hypothetical protein
VNAIPSEPRTPRAGRSGGARCRDDAIITGPPVVRVKGADCGLEPGKTASRDADETCGMRQAKKGGRRVPVARLTAQGRVGQSSRHVVTHLASLPLLSARTSVLPDADRYVRSTSCPSRLRNAPWVLQVSMRSVAQPQMCSSLETRRGGAKLVPTADGAPAHFRGEFRRKGVLAA